MPIQFECPTCGKQYAISENFAGRKAHCKECKAPFTVPTANADLQEPQLDQLEEIATPRCPYCEAEIAEGAILCVHCGRNLRTGQTMRTTVARADPRRISFRPQQPSGLGRMLKSPISYVAAGSLVFILALLCSPKLSLYAGVGIIWLGFGIAVLGYIYYGISMWVACYREHGILPIIGLFIPIVMVFVNIWMIIKYWAYAWRAVASLAVGILIMIGGIVVGSTLGKDALQLAASTKVSAPEFPVLPAPSHPAAGIDLYNIRIGGTGPGTNMRVLLYMPAGGTERAAHSLPCVLIAPAGTTMLTGITLAPDDAREHLDYVRRGFAVTTFDLDGPAPKDNNQRAFATAIRSFRDARYGLVNAHNAIEYLLQKVPAIDPDKLFAAGHSSAGGFALNLAADDHRIKGVAAYAPSTDILRHQPAKLFSAMKLYMRDIEDFSREASPLSHVEDIDCPVMIFHANDDEVVSAAEIQSFVEMMKAAGKNVQLKTVARGGHYDSMIQQGIGQGIAFLLPLAPHAAAAGAAAKANMQQPTPVPAAPVPQPSSQMPGKPMPDAGKPAAMSQPKVEPTRPAEVTPDIRIVASHYAIPTPSGFKAVEKNDPASEVVWWMRTGKPPSSFTVMVQKAPWHAVTAIGQVKTIKAGTITFVEAMPGSSSSELMRFEARDGEYYLLVTADNQRRDPAVTQAMLEAIAKIRPVAEGEIIK